MLRNDTLAMETCRTKLMQLDAVLYAALHSWAIDPDWKRKELELLREAHKAQGKK